MWKFERCSDDEGLRLILAFFQITDPDVRLALIEAAEAAAKRSPEIALPDLELPQDNFPPPERFSDR